MCCGDLNIRKWNRKAWISDFSWMTWPTCIPAWQQETGAKLPSIDTVCAPWSIKIFAHGWLHLFICKPVTCRHLSLQFPIDNRKHLSLVLISFSYYWNGQFSFSFYNWGVEIVLLFFFCSIVCIIRELQLSNARVEGNLSSCLISCSCYIWRI